MSTKKWYRAKIRWAVMMEGRGLREWEEGVYLFRSEDFDTAFQHALAIGEGGQSGGEEGTWRPRWTETRLAQVIALDCLGAELEDELEVHWERKRAKERIAFEHRFEPAKQLPQPAI